MALLMRWSVLIVGLLLIAIFATVFVTFAVVMTPFGGVPYSWSLLFINIHWIIMLAAGVLLVVSAAAMFRRAKNRIS